MGLKKEIDDLRFMLNEKSRLNNDYQGEIAGNRDQINRKEGDITGTQRDLAHKSDQGYQLRKDIDNLSYEVQKLKEEKLKDLDEIARMRELSQYRERENGDQGQRIRAVDYDLLKS
jgi:chromosome segregation ATPase